MSESPMHQWLNKVCRWRNVFAGWQLGTRLSTDPECQAVKDHREVTILLRIETTSFLRVLFEKGICTPEEYERIIIEEAQHLDKMYEERFPGIKTNDIGVQYSKQAIETMKGWKP